MNNKKSIAFIFSMRGKAEWKISLNVSYDFNLLVHFLLLRARTRSFIMNGLAAVTVLQSIQ